MDRECESCENFSANDGRWHIRKDVPVALLSSILVLALAVGGWIYSYATQTAAVAETARRIALLEQRTDVSERGFKDITERLARMEPMLDLLVAKLKEQK